VRSYQPSRGSDPAKIEALTFANYSYAPLNAIRTHAHTHTHTHEGGNLTDSAICYTFIMRGITQYPRMPATSEIHPPEFRDAANKSEYRLIWLSASQFLPSRLPVPTPFPLREGSLRSEEAASEIRFSRSRISILMNFGLPESKVSKTMARPPREEEP